MPDKHGFNHLPDRGLLSHQCIRCGWPGYGRFVNEADRAQHHLDCTADERKEAEAKAAALRAERIANLAKAREAKANRQKENA